MLSNTTFQPQHHLPGTPLQQPVVCRFNNFKAHQQSLKHWTRRRVVAAVLTGHPQGTAGISRRQELAAGVSTLLLPWSTWAGAAASVEAQDAAAGSTAQLQPYTNTQQQYRLSIPADWEKKDKAGADVLFEDPGRRSSSVGVTVSPVRVASIEQFGDLEAVGKRLLDAERKKESTLGVELLSSASRRGASGARLYDYEYQLDSTRGLKRIFNTVTITGSKLYILNANFKCDKEAGCAAAEAGTIALLRGVAASFDAGATF